MPIKALMGVPAGQGGLAINDTDVASGLITYAVGDLNGTAIPAAWSGPAADHPGFLDAVTDGGDGVYTVELSTVPTGRWWAKATDRSGNSRVVTVGSTGNPNPGSILIRAFNPATGNPADTRLIITVTAANS